MGMYVNVCGSVPCPALCEVRSCCPSFFAVLGMALSFLLPPRAVGCTTQNSETGMLLIKIA